MTTLKTIAKEAGVSVDTVSRVLGNRNKGRRQLANQRAERIRQIAERLNYRPNQAARSLRLRKSRTVGVLWSLSGPHPSEKVPRHISLSAQKHGYATYICDHLQDPKVTAEALADYHSRQVDGVVVQGSEQLLEDAAVKAQLRSFDAVALVVPVAYETDMDLVIHERTYAMQEIANHFVAGGRRRPLALGSRNSVERRTEAFREHYEASGAGEAVQVLTVPKQPGFNLKALDYWNALNRYFADREFPHDAVWCGTDEGAVAMCRWLRERGLSVPEDVAVVGFNDDSEDRFLEPPLASVNLCQERLVEQIERVLFQRLERPHRPRQQVHVAMRFVWRWSAGEPSEAR